MDEAAGVTTMPAAVVTATAAIPQQADSDAHLVALWLHGRTARTLAAYANEARAFLAFAAMPLRAVTLGDLHAYMDSLAALAPASRQCRLAAIKSLFGFAHRLGYLPFNPGAAVRLPPAKDARAERIVTAQQVHRLLDREPDPRNAAMLGLLYAAGLRISEFCGLAWRDLQPRGDAGQLTVFGKGGRTRAILLPASVWRSVTALHGDAAPIGCGTPMLCTRSTTGRRSAWCRRRSATPASPPRAATCTSGRTTAAPGISGFRGASPACRSAGPPGASGVAGLPSDAEIEVVCGSDPAGQAEQEQQRRGHATNQGAGA